MNRAHRAVYLAHRADRKIADLVRSKLISGNDVPVERCTIFSKEIQKIDEEITAADIVDVLDTLKNVDALDGAHVPYSGEEETC